ncbi:Deoxyguanosinetriphosphate triphosphohydrolase-like protein [bioreactor metagenome]|uniref:Deoxyguanosinetriphosphate triphosphohydrolase-like protein n=1 Tax=bioreactor metagenome TaxID=1076179 RepID=A0A644U8W7_9ZZZZ|nr:dNTP triphosphohydrolase [Methanobrevibacter sp.]MEA4957989.1 dNTP triphosphohydrolase [Methanobrevibacter sp.]
MKLSEKKYIEIYKQNKKFTKNNEPTNEDRYDSKLERDYKEYIKRSAVAVDRDRILFSSAFRRLEHKAQVYSNEKGDHCRTRLTHSLEVVQISRSLAKNLGLNEELTEAIALGHDIGHTPFGHEGEYVLDSIMRGENDLGNNIRPDFKKGFDFKGFKHNFFSLEILDSIENRYSKSQGLNFTWQVLEGILKHTSIQKENKEKNVIKKWDLYRFLKNSDNLVLKEAIKRNFDDSVTLEGQIVAISDEIAQRQHDLDDGLRDSSLKLDIEGIIEQMKIDDIIKDAKNYQAKNLLKDFYNKLKQISENTDEHLRKKELTSGLVNYFIEDVTLTSLKNLNKLYEYTDTLKSTDKQIITKKLICFSEKCGEKVDANIKNFINSQIINSFNVSRFDGKSEFIIKQLFKAYYSNPRQMPINMLEKLIIYIEKNCKNFELEKENKMAYESLYDINLQTSSVEEFKIFLDVLKLENLSIIMTNKNIPKEIRKDYLSNILHQLIKYKYHENVNNSYIDSSFKDKNFKKLTKSMQNSYRIEGVVLEDLKKNVKMIKMENIKPILNEKKENISEWLFNKFDTVLKNKDIDNMNNEELFYRCLLENHYAFLKIISEYIAKMSDNFAKKEFEKIYMS